MRKSFSFDGLFAALAVLSASTASVGCSKSESARNVEEGAMKPAATTTATSETTPAVAPAAAPAAAASAGGAVDAGIEIAPASSAAPARKIGGSAACGAQGCSPDMKKGK